MATKVPPIIPRSLIPSRNDMVSVGMWGGTAVLGGLWLVQPWGWIKSVTVGDEEAEAEAQKNDQGRGQPKPPAAESGEETKDGDDEGEEGGDEDEGEEKDSKDEGGDSEDKEAENDKDSEEGKDDSKSKGEDKDED